MKEEEEKSNNLFFFNALPANAWGEEEWGSISKIPTGQQNFPTNFHETLYELLYG